MVLGTEVKIIEDVVGVLGGTCSIIEASTDLDTFYGTTIFEEFAKAAASSCYWIVIKETSETFNWPMFYEPLNTVTDDNKVFITHDDVRHEFPSSARLVILASTAKLMSPAMVSRLGTVNMIHWSNVAKTKYFIKPLVLSI